jgi:adenylate cyclase class IV
MPKEYEHAFFDFNKKDIISKIKKLNGTHKGVYLFRVQVFIHPFKKPGTYVRVRDEGYRTTMTYKYQAPKELYPEENEVLIDNFDEGVKILLGIGCKKKYYYEKIRDIWNVKNTEVVFDTNPGVDDRMEVESKTKSEMTEMIKYFGLKIEDRSERYLDLFGIVIPKSIDLTFKNVKSALLPYVKKNKEKFIELVNDQFDMYKKVIKKKSN